VYSLLVGCPRGVVYVVFFRRTLLFFGAVVTVAAAAGLSNFVAVSSEAASDPLIVAATDSPPSIGARTSTRVVDPMASFGTDLRQPRKPRHRSDRPSKQLIETDFTEAVQSAIDFDRSLGHFVPHRPAAATLAGHPLELLRPPSFEA
jgi:hypothetical protein